MTFSVMTNANALAALESLTVTQHSLSQAQARISSGLKVANASDAPSTFAIAQGMRGDIAGFQAIADSIALAQNVVTVASQAVQTVANDLNQLKGSVVSAEDPTQNKADIQNRVTALLAEIQSTVNAAQFNGVNILNSGGSGLQVNVAFNRTGTNNANVSISQMVLSQQDLSFSTGQLQNIANLNVNQPAANVATFDLGNIPVIKGNDVFTLVTQTPSGALQTYDFEFINSNSPTTLASQPNATTQVVQVNFNSTKDSPQAALNNLFTAMAQQGFSGQFLPNGGQFQLSGIGMQSAAYTPTAGNGGSTVVGSGGVPGAAGVARSGTMGGSNLLTAVENAINSVTNVAAQIGAFQNELQDQSMFVQNLTNALTTGVGNLVDADMAAESANLQAAQTRQSLGIQALSIANQGSSAVMALFR